MVAQLLASVLWTCPGSTKKMNAVGKAYSKRNGFFGSKTIVMAGKSNGKCGKIHLLQEAATIRRSYSSESGAVHLFATAISLPQNKGSLKLQRVVESLLKNIGLIGRNFDTREETESGMQAGLCT